MQAQITTAETFSWAALFGKAGHLERPPWTHVARMWWKPSGARRIVGGMGFPVTLSISLSRAARDPATDATGAHWNEQHRFRHKAPAQRNGPRTSRRGYQAPAKANDGHRPCGCIGHAKAGFRDSAAISNLRGPHLRDIDRAVTHAETSSARGAGMPARPTYCSSTRYGGVPFFEKSFNKYALPTPPA